MRHGEPFHGEVVTGDASGGIAFALYKAGTVTPYVLKANEFISITDILLSMAAAGTYSIVADTATPGQYICTGLANALAKGEVTWQ